MSIQKYLDNDIPELYVVAKRFNQKGSICYRFRNKTEIRSVPDVLELLRTEDTQIVLLDNRDVYREYAPYKEIEDLKEFINLVINAKQ